MKFKILVAACATVFGSQAHALSPAVSEAAATVKVFGSGASAQFNSIQALFDNVCNPGTKDTYNSTTSANLVGISCTIKAGVPGLAGKNVLFSYNADGGSGNGVYPIAKQVLSTGTLNSASFVLRPQITKPSTGGCTLTATANVYSCPAGANQNVYSDFGVSDVEPAMFKLPLNRPSAFASQSLADFELANLDVGSQNQVIFGIAASNNLYADLQTAQGLAGAQVPSLSKSVIASLLAGNLSDPSNGLGWQALFTPGTLPAGAAVTGQVNVCRRVNGSGTQTAANAYFHSYACSGAANLEPADASFNNPGSFVVGMNSGTNDVMTCVTNAFNANQYAIGLVSKENDPSANPASRNKWKHVKIDGIEPTRANVVNGLYDYFYEQTMQWNNAFLDGFRTAQFALPAGTTITDLKDFLVEFRNRAGEPLVFASASFPATVANGVAAIANDAAGYIFNDPAATPEGAANRAFVSRQSRGGNSCQPPLWVK